MRFGDHLRSWSPQALNELLSARPDLLAASDHGFDAVARKAASAVSLGRCLIRADVGMLVVAEALTVISPATAAEIDELLGTNDIDAVVDALGRLQRRGVVVVEDGVASPLGALEDLLVRPLGLGPSFVELADQVPSRVFERLTTELGVSGARKPTATARAIARRLRDPIALGALVARAPEESRHLLDALVERRSATVGLPLGFLYQGSGHPRTDDPRSWLLDHGLLVAVSDGVGEVPREVVMGSMPAGLAPGAALRPIELRPVAGLGADDVAAAGADRAGTTLDAAEAILRLAADQQIAVRRAGGIGVREVNRLAKQLEAEPRDVGRIIELLHQARLVRSGRTALAATELADTWWRLSRGRRWLVLVRAWVASASFVSRALSTDEEGNARPALGDTEPLAAAAASRAVVLAAVATLDAGEAYDRQQLAESVVWRSPNLWGAGTPPPDELVSWTLEEATLLGLVAEAAPVPALRSLAASDEAELETRAAVALGTDQTQVVLQDDLSAVALGPLDPAVAASLGQLADRRWDRSVPTYRFTEASLRRGLDRGWTAASVGQFLAAHALSGVPQPLQYLMSDVDRRYGSVRVLTASSVVVTDDEALAVEIASSTRAARLGLRLVAPTVLIGPVEPHQMVDELRHEGYFPILDGSRLTVAANDESGAAAPARPAGSPPGRAAAAAATAGRPEGLPADWTGPPLDDAVLPVEVAEAVEVLLSDSSVRTPTELDHRLHLQWNRPTLVRHLRDGQLQEARGVLVGVDETLTLLCESGIEELPLDAVVAVEDPTR